MSLILSRRLGPLLVTQTLGAINDNLFKNALVVMVLFTASRSAGAALAAGAGAVFILPYGLLSATAGQIADRFEKSRVIRWVKLGEAGLMLLAAAGFLLPSVPLLFLVLFGLGVQATFFSPLKYGILPSHLPERELVAGNGLIEAGTFIGILAGTIAGSALFAWPCGAAIVSGVGLAVAAAGIASAALIPAAPSQAAGLRIGWNFLAETGRLIGMARQNRVVWLCLLGLSWFWAIGATILGELPALVRDDLRGAAPVFTLMLAFFSVGAGMGSLVCARLLHNRVSARFVPHAAVGLSVFMLDFAYGVGHGPGKTHTAAALLHSLAGWHMLLDLLLLAGCGGLYSVPLYAIIQDYAAPSRLARMVAANNVLNAVAMVLASGLAAGLALAGLAPVAVLRAAAIANLLVAAWIIRLPRAVAAIPGG